MKIKKTILTVFILLSSIFLFINSFAAVPHLINYQGRLTDSSGNPLNGSYSLTFRIYDAEAAGNLLWEEVQSGVVIQKGTFNALLGSVTNLGLPFDKPYFLEIKVGNEVMSPRQRITSAGYAIRAEKAETAGNSEKLNGQPDSYYLDHGNLIGLSDNDHPQYVRGKGNNYKIDCGSKNLAAGYSSTAINFNFTFSAPPIVVIGYDLVNDEHGSVATRDITTAGFNAINNRPGVAVTAYWIAMGPAQ